MSGLKSVSEETQQDVKRRLEAYIDALLRIKSVIPPFNLDILPKMYQNNTFDGKIFSLDQYDGALLFPERFPDVVGDTQVYQSARSSFQIAEDILANFWKDIGFRPNPYYALLVADGDAMGKVIDHQATYGMARHKALSEALTKFADKVRAIIKEQMGVRIYSGGDDVLAMLPLHTAVECSRLLSQEFHEALKDFADEKGTSPTLSVGLAIVHHLHPLGDALKLARAAEGRAKGLTGKNALAITVQKRGGSPCEVSGRWGVFETRLEQQIRLYQRGIIPAGMAYELEEIALRLEPDADHAKDQPASPPHVQHLEPDADHTVDPAISLPHVQYAALRVFQRKLGEAGRQEKNKEDAPLALYALKRMVGLIGLNGASETPDKAFDALKKLLGLKNEDTQRLNELREKVRLLDEIQPVRVRQLADELVVARLFAQARRLAEGKSEGVVEA